MLEAWAPTRPLIISHRGLTPGARENTLEGITRALASGADAVEVDVRITADGIPILHHDPELDGLPVHQTAHGALRDRARVHGYELLRVRDLLDRTGPDARVNLEIKDPAALEPTLALVDDDPRVPPLVTGFNPSVIQAIREVRPDLPAGLILGPSRIYRLLFSRRRGQRLRSWFPGSRPDVLVVHRTFLRVGLASTVFATHVPVVVWTINGTDRLQRAMEHPLLWGVITDEPARAHRARNLTGGHVPSQLDGREIRLQRR